MKDHFFCMNSENWLLQLASRHDMNRSVGEALCICNISTWCFSFSVSAYSSNLICDQEDAGAGLVISLLFWESNLFTEWGLTAHKCTRKTVPVWAKKAYSRSSGTVHNYHDIFCPWLFGSMTTLAKWKLRAAENITHKKIQCLIFIEQDLWHVHSVTVSRFWIHQYFLSEQWKCISNIPFHMFHNTLCPISLYLGNGFVKISFYVSMAPDKRNWIKEGCPM